MLALGGQCERGGSGVKGIILPVAYRISVTTILDLQKWLLHQDCLWSCGVYYNRNAVRAPAVITASFGGAPSQQKDPLRVKKICTERWQIREVNWPKGRWTYEYISSIEKRVEDTVSSSITWHNYFQGRSMLCLFLCHSGSKHEQTPGCWHCCNVQEDVEHIFFNFHV